VGLFDDDATGRVPSAASSSPSSVRRRRDRHRTRLQRIAILAAILFVVVFALAWWARSCQQNHKVASYRTYFEGVSAAIDDSAALGKQLSSVIFRPTRFSRKELIAKLDELSARQNEIAVRADRLEPPDTLTEEQGVFAEGMAVRTQGFKLFEATMLPVLTNKSVSTRRLASLAGYFSGPDAYYMGRVYTQARTTMSEEGVTDVAVPTATYYLNATMFDPARLDAMLASVGSSTKLTGIHGVALMDVTAQPGDNTLSSGTTTSIPSTADLAFDVTVQNQGDVTEQNVNVTAELTLPGGTPLTETGTIASIGAGQMKKVTIQGFVIPEQALSRVSTLKVTAGPVRGERVTSNNAGRYKILLQLK